MRRYSRFGLVSVLAAGVVGGGLAVVQPAVADHTVDDVNCSVTHCVQAPDLASGDLTNYAEDGSFERAPAAQVATPPVRSWASRTGSPAWRVIQSPADCYQSNRCARRDGNGTASTATLGNVSQPDARGGESFRLTAAFRSINGATGQAGLRIDWALADGTVQIGPSSMLNAEGTGAWRTTTVSGVAPPGTVHARLLLIATNSAGSWLADTVEFRRLLTNGHLATNSVVGANIVDGSIGRVDLLPAIVDTSKLADSAVTSIKTLDNSLTGADVANGSLTLSDMLLAGANGLDSRYPNRTELTGGTPNTAGNPVSWGKLYNMPAAFADGVDNNAPRVLSASSTGTDVFTPVCNSSCRVVTVNLPAGKWMMSGTVHLSASNAEDRIFAKCWIGADPAGASFAPRSFVNLDASASANITTHPTGWVSGPGTGFVACGDDDQSDTHWQVASVMAVQVS